MERADPRIEAYLDRLCEPLHRTLSGPKLEAYRDEARFHLESLAAEIAEAERIALTEAVERALREFGQPDLIAIDLLDEHAKGTRPVGFAQGARSSTLWAFVWFGLASALTLILTQAGELVSGLGHFSDVAPGLWLLMPIAAGVLTGRTVPTGNLRAVMLALVPILLHTALVATLLGLSEVGWQFLQFQLWAWPLFGGVSTFLTALLRRRPRRQRPQRLPV